MKKLIYLNKFNENIQSEGPLSLDQFEEIFLEISDRFECTFNHNKGGFYCCKINIRQNYKQIIDTPAYLISTTVNKKALNTDEYYCKTKNELDDFCTQLYTDINDEILYIDQYKNNYIKTSNEIKFIFDFLKANLYKLSIYSNFKSISISKSSYNQFNIFYDIKLDN